MTKEIHTCDRCKKVIDNGPENYISNARHLRLFDFSYKDRCDARDLGALGIDICAECVMKLQHWLHNATP